VRLLTHLLIYFLLYFKFPFNSYRGIVSLIIFLEKTKQKIVAVLESLCFQGRSQQHGFLKNDEAIANFKIFNSYYFK